MVFNIVIVSILIILIFHYSFDYLKTLLNPSPPILEDLKYKKYKAMIDDISRLKIEPEPDDDGVEDLESYFQTKVEFEERLESTQDV
jgi:hypothetical protein